MRVLITGGYGYLGARIAQHMASLGHDVALGTARSNLVLPECLASFTSIILNWTDSNALTLACQNKDIVIHAAGMNAQSCAANPVAALEFNGVATARLAQAAAQARVRRFIYLSTAHVYCAPLSGTITEDTCPSNLHAYATSHLAGENAVLSAARAGEISGIVLRLSNVLGAPAYAGVNAWMLLMNDLCKQAVLEKRITLSGNGRSIRDFVPFGTVLRLIGNMIGKNASFGSVINVGAGRSHSVYEMAKLVQESSRDVLGFEPEIRINDQDKTAAPSPLHYLSKYTELRHSNDTDDELRYEIDELLRSCKSWFAR